MAKHSSISSSDPSQLPGGFPAAFLLAIGIIALFEAGIRWIGPRGMMPYAIGELEYSGVAAWVREFGPAEVCFIGSSRGREAISAPVIHSRLQQLLRHDLSVSNFSMAGARTSETSALVTQVLRQGHPQLILYGMTPRVLLGEEERNSRAALFLDMQDFFDGRYGLAGRQFSVLPVLARNQLGRWYKTLRFRERLGIAAREFIMHFVDPIPEQSITDILTLKPPPSALGGGPTPWQRKRAGVSLVSRPISEERVNTYVRFLLRDGEYPLSETKLEHLRQILGQCEEAGVQIVLFEIPIPEILRRHFPVGTLPRFRDRVGAIAATEGVPFVRLDELAVRFEDADFLEQSHLNLRGAEKLSKALAEQVIAPLLAKGNELSDN